MEQHLIEETSRQKARSKKSGKLEKDTQIRFDPDFIPMGTYANLYAVLANQEIGINVKRSLHVAPYLRSFARIFTVPFNFHVACGAFSEALLGTETSKSLNSYVISALRPVSLS
jgi:hypothetical protein